MDVNLTKNADTLMCLLYKQYCQNRNDGLSNLQSKFFGSSAKIQETIAPKWTLEDVENALSSLSQADLINCLYGEGNVSECNITNDGIIYMENRFKNGLTEVLDYLGKIRNVLPI